jgi:hypothetical protein
MHKTKVCTDFVHCTLVGRVAGLRSSGKGANRTILDCLFWPERPNEAVILPPRGRGRWQLLVSYVQVHTCVRRLGRVLPAAAKERVWKRDDCDFG